MKPRPQWLLLAIAAAIPASLTPLVIYSGSMIVEESELQASAMQKMSNQVVELSRRLNAEAAQTDIARGIAEDAKRGSDNAIVVADRARIDAAEAVELVKVKRFAKK